ncbi:hypothetical protein TDB9533_02210 [Thalassocella blandensis]|nr:hypothetical protein TDB9533_02210 [Thalassocella blandensis]
MIRKILFATDLGAFTPHALVHVESLASQYDAKVSLVHVVPPISEFTSAIVKSYCSEAVKHELLESRNIKGLLESVRDEVFDLIASNSLIEDNLLTRLQDIVIVPGKPANVILFEAERLNADLIVIGNHGPEAIDGKILGSVASKVLQLAKVPVYMVPMMEAIAVRLPLNKFM